MLWSLLLLSTIVATAGLVNHGVGLWSGRGMEAFFGGAGRWSLWYVPIANKTGQVLLMVVVLAENRDLAQNGVTDRPDVAMIV